MPIISITITPSTEQVLPGIPTTIALSTNIPSVLFYTLNGTTPNTYSPIYVAPIIMPETQLTVTLSVVASNGTDTSAVVVQTYTANNAAILTAAGARLPHSATTPVNNSSTSNSLFPFGTSGPNPDSQYLNPGDAGTTVYNESEPAIPSGFDGSGNPSGFTNLPIDNYEFQQVYSTLTYQNEEEPGVGNLPATTTTIGSQYPIQFRKEQSDLADKVFNPRALVVYQDSTTEDPTNPVLINRPYFSLENTETTRDGDLLYNTTVDSPPTMGGFVTRHYNARTNMLTYYYYDNTVGRWIISTTPFQSTSNIGALSTMVFGRSSDGNNGGKRYTKWFPFARRYLM